MLTTLLLLGVLLTWQDNADNEDGFVVERNRTGTWEVIGYTGVNETSFSDAFVIDKDIFRVAAFNQVGLSDYSNEAQYLAPLPKPCVPKNKKGKGCKF